MALKKKVEIYLDDNDWKEINSALPQLAKHRLIQQNDLFGEWCDMPDDNFLQLLESFNLSFAKEADDNWNSDEGLDDIPGFGEAIQDIDTKVSSYMDNNKIEVKVADFSLGSSELYRWLDNYEPNYIISILSNVLWNNRNNSLADKIIQAITAKD